MIREIKRLFNIAAVVAIGSIMLWSCEPDPDGLGSQFFTGAQANNLQYPLIAYNVGNNDSIRTDALKIDSAAVGAFAESQFGMQKADYVTQLRPSLFAPDFGTNPVLDSAVISIKPAFYTVADSVVTNTYESFNYNDANNTNVEAKKVVNIYKIRKYGKTKIGGNTNFNIKIYRVSDFLASAADIVYSNRNVGTSSLLGSGVFNGRITSIKITKKSDGSDLYNRDPSIRIPLDSLTFQNDIIKKGGAPELGDAATFIRFFRGLKISVAENDGYFFKFTPQDLSIYLYYKNDQTVAGVTKRVQQVFPMNLGSPNAHFSQIQFDRTNTPSATFGGDKINGDPKLYLQGMGGNGAGFKVPDAAIAALKTKFKNDKAGIISAKIRIYTDPGAWNNNYTKPGNFIVRQDGLFTFLTDMSALAYSGKYDLVRTYDLSKTPGYYDIDITQTIKNIIEKEAPNKDFIINVGTYTTNVQGNLVGAGSIINQQNYNTRSYTPNRAVFVGTVNSGDPLFSKTPTLSVSYGQKN